MFKKALLICFLASVEKNILSLQCLSAIKDNMLNVDQEIMQKCCVVCNLTETAGCGPWIGLYHNIFAHKACLVSASNRICRDESGRAVYKFESKKYSVIWTANNGQIIVLKFNVKHQSFRYHPYGC